jgi:acyl-CoA thioesterase-1
MHRYLLNSAGVLAVLIGLAACTASQTSQSTEEQPQQTQAEQEQALPRVLLIGDSISQGYRRTVVAELEEVAEVSRVPGNGEWTGTGVKKIDAWLGDTDWDVIHFNWGLWDMYGWTYYDQDRSPKAYAERLDMLVKRLKQTDAVLIWATTTPPCPENEVSMRERFKAPGIVTPEVEQQYLDAAQRVMQRHGIKINDLNALVREDLDTLQTGPDNVHFTAEGSAMLGRQVAAAIRDALDLPAK